MTKGLFVAGAGKDAGKTTLCLGLLDAFREMVPSGVAFTKPLGQKTTLVQGEQVGQDSWFVDRALGMGLPLEKSAPFASSSGAAARYISTGEPSDLPAIVKRAYRYLGRKGRMVVVEGTGHPGVGSVFDMSNARVAKILGTPVLLVLDGGIGSTIDRFNLCASMFRYYDVPILGVVINRIIPNKMDKVRELLGKWFLQREVPVFGYIPYEDAIARPSLGLIQKAVGANPVVSFSAGGAGGAAGYLAAFDSSEQVLGQIGRDPCRTVLVSLSRHGVLDAIAAARVAGGTGPAAVIVCGGEPRQRHAKAFRALEIPLFWTPLGLEQSTGNLAGRIFKVEPHEEGKIRRIVELVRGNVDAGAILDSLSGRPGEQQKRPGGIRGFFRNMFRK
jgi:dethiobiotin synthetase